MNFKPTRRTFFDASLGGLLAAVLHSSWCPKTKTFKTGQAIRVNFEGATLPRGTQSSTMTFDFDLPGKGMHTAMVDFIPSNMHPTHWDGTVVALGPKVKAPPLEFPDHPVVPTQNASFAFQVSDGRPDKEFFSRYVL